MTFAFNYMYPISILLTLLKQEHCLLKDNMSVNMFLFEFCFSVHSFVLANITFILDSLCIFHVYAKIRTAHSPPINSDIISFNFFLSLCVQKIKHKYVEI